MTAGWLRCPRCLDPLEPVEPLVWGCASGHRFDANKRGYVTLTTKAGIAGDSAEMIAARSRFLDAGHYSPIADAITAVIPATAARIIDAGCGTGHYLAAALEAMTPPTEALAFDISPAAVTAAVRRTGATGLVADSWQPLPIRDATADVLLCVFAPRAPAEFARVLRDNGRLVVVTPRPDHLGSLRDAGTLIGMQADKSAKLDAALGGGFELASRTAVDYLIALSPDEVAQVTQMGPTGHHTSTERRTQERPRELTQTRVAVDVSVFLPRG